MKRNHLLFIVIGLLLVGNIIYHMWSNWGLITIHSKDQPLGEVIRSIEKQGHVKIQTNLDLVRPIEMNVTKVALAEAMETLSVVVDGRWHLTYFVAQDKGTIDAALAGLGNRTRPEGWRSLYVPLMGEGMGADQAVMPDPRQDTWAVKPAKEPTLQSYLEQASRNVSAGFVVPEGYNPPVTSPPSSGVIAKALPKLIDAAKGKYEEIFVLQGFRVAENDSRGRRGGGENEEFRGGRESMEERMRNEIAKLPAEEQKVAQQEFDARKAFFEGLRDLPPAERDAKMQAFMEVPENQEKMENANAARDARRSPQQRMARGKQYMQRMAQARSGGTK